MSFVIVIIMAIVTITTGMGRATANGADCEFGADSPRQAGPEGADPETAARWRQAPQVAPGCLVQDYAARGWKMVCQQFQETLGLGLYRVDGPRSPFPQASASAGFLSSPGRQTWGQRQASAVLICLKCNTAVTT